MSNENAQNDISMQNVQNDENVNGIQNSELQNEPNVQSGASVDPIPDLGDDPDVLGEHMDYLESVDPVDAEPAEKESGISTKTRCNDVSPLAGATPLLLRTFPLPCCPLLSSL